MSTCNISIFRQTPRQVAVSLLQPQLFCTAVLADFHYCWNHLFWYCFLQYTLPMLWNRWVLNLPLCLSVCYVNNDVARVHRLQNGIYASLWQTPITKPVSFFRLVRNLIRVLILTGTRASRDIIVLNMCFETSTPDAQLCGNALFSRSENFISLFAKCTVTYTAVKTLRVTRRWTS